MNELEQIREIKSEISKLHEKIKEQMLSLVKKLGGEVESCCGRTYKATEDTSVNCVIEAFVIEDEVLMVKTDFDGDRFTLSLDSFDAAELANILFLMIEDNNRFRTTKINNLLDRFNGDNVGEPKYARCSVQFLGESESMDVTIKLSSDVEEQDDDNIFFYCNSSSDLKYYVALGVEDFVITDCIEFSNEL